MSPSKQPGSSDLTHCLVETDDRFLIFLKLIERNVIVPKISHLSHTQLRFESVRQKSLAFDIPDEHGLEKMGFLCFDLYYPIKNAGHLNK